MQTVVITKKTNKDLKNIEIKMNKMLNKMNNLFNKQFKAMEDQILEIEDKIDEIEQKLWPDYFYIEAVNDNTIVRPEIEGTGYLKYTKTPDNDSSWTDIGSLEDINLNADEKVYFHGNLTPAQESGGGDTYAVKFHATDYIRCGGNVYYIADEDGKLTKSYQCAHLFDGCDYLMNAPELPATTLTNNCYDSMFKDALYGLGLSFTPPALPATTLADFCYSQMFSGTHLASVPELPATTLARYCYYYMFAGTSITTAPELPATTLAQYCYCGMFSNTGITTAPELPALTLVPNCYDETFKGCQYLNYIKCLATTMTDPMASYTYEWLQGVAATGTFVKNAEVTHWTTGESGIPVGWTIINA